MAPSIWSEFVHFMAAKSPVIALLILLFEIAVFGIGFALGHVSAILER
jgi:hypothetical protein